MSDNFKAKSKFHCTIIKIPTAFIIISSSVINIRGPVDAINSTRPLQDALFRSFSTSGSNFYPPLNFGGLIDMPVIKTFFTSLELIQKRFSKVSNVMQVKYEGEYHTSISWCFIHQAYF
jgi:hypothetical protein